MLFLLRVPAEQYLVYRKGVLSGRFDTSLLGNYWGDLVSLYLSDETRSGWDIQSDPWKVQSHGQPVDGTEFDSVISVSPF